MDIYKIIGIYFGVVIGIWILKEIIITIKCGKLLSSIFDFLHIISIIVSIAIVGAICASFQLKWWVYVISIVIIIWIVGSIWKKIEKKEYLSRKKKDFIKRIRSHNELAKLFFNTGAPVLKYVEALENIYNKGEALDDKQFAFYLSYPKKIEIVKGAYNRNRPQPDAFLENKAYEEGKHLEFISQWDDYCMQRVIVNGIDLGYACENSLFHKNPYHVRDLIEEGKEIFIDEYNVCIFDDYFPDGFSKKDLKKYGNFEKESKEIIKKYEKQLPKNVLDLLSLLKNKELSFEELKKLIDEFSKKAQKEYFSEKAIDEGFFDNKNDENTYYQSYLYFFNSYDKVKEIKYKYNIPESLTEEEFKKAKSEKENERINRVLEKINNENKKN